MSLTVMSVAYPLTPVGPDAVGGSEQILTLLDQAIVRAGHTSLVVAAEGSTTHGTLIPTPKWNGPITDDVRNWAARQYRKIIKQALRDYHVDLIHMHSLDFWRYMPPPGPAMLVTLHLPPDWYPWEVFQLKRPKSYVNCVSAAETQRCPPDARILPYIDNGVDIDRLSVPYKKCDYVFALGRICPEKGLHHALEAAIAAQVPLLLAGQVYPYEAHQKYFQQEIVPRLDAERRFIGPAGFRNKRRLLTQARALLIPSLVAETSSLVAMEALSCGTPVIAFPNGALPEIVDEGVTGFIVKDETEMAEALRAVKYLDPEVCRRVARERFSAERMASRYIERYQQILAENEPAPALAIPALAGADGG